MDNTHPAGSTRISRLKAALFCRPRDISLERALLYTESHRQSEGEPVPLRRARATANVLAKVAISIRDDELIAGNRTIKPRAGIVSPEMDPYWIAKELDTFHSRPQDKFLISERDKDIYRTELYPYWEGRSMKDFINAQFSQSQELDADNFSYDLLTQKKLKREALVSAFQKLAQLSGGEHSMLASHPASADRAKNIETRIASNK